MSYAPQSFLPTVPKKPRFGPLDRTIIVVILLCFLLCVAGLIYYPLTH